MLSIRCFPQRLIPSDTLPVKYWRNLITVIPGYKSNVVHIHGMNYRKTKVRSYSFPSHPDDITANSSGVNVNGTSNASILKLARKN